MLPSLEKGSLQMQLGLRTLSWGNYPGLPREAQINPMLIFLLTYIYFTVLC